MIHNIETIYNVLKQDERLLSTDGDLLKNKVYELAMKMDSALIKALATDSNTKEMFFTEIDNVLVFDKVKFGWVVDSQGFLPDSYTSFKNDIMLVDNQGNSISSSNNVVLSFPFKDCIIEVDSTESDEKREEVFFNEILAKKEIDTLLAPKVLTNGIRYSKDKKENILELTEDDNLLIKGNNLVAINTLLPRYEGQVKLMYWDILYNTDNDLVPYNDSFKHSSWLVMMKNRLQDAKDLLKEDGLICVQLDDNEQAYFKVLCDEVFGRDNFVSCVCIKMSHLSGVKMSHVDKKLPKIKEYVLIYAKNKESIKLNPLFEQDNWFEVFDRYNSYLIRDENNPDDYSKWSVKTVRQVAVDKGIDVSKDTNGNYKKEYEEFCINNSANIFRTARNRSQVFEELPNDDVFREIETSTGLKRLAYKKEEVLFCIDKMKEVDGKMIPVKPLGDIWTDIGINNLHNEGGVDFRNGKKPEKLVKRFIELGTQEGDLVLDAYFGSGTTGAVALKMNRRFIGIEQLDKHHNMALERIQSVITGEQSGVSKELNWKGGGSFVSLELKSLSSEIIDKVRTASSADLIEIYKEISESPFLNYKAEIYKLKESETKFELLSDDDKRKLLIELVDKNTLYVNYADMDDVSYNVTEEEKSLTNSFYNK